MGWGGNNIPCLEVLIPTPCDIIITCLVLIFETLNCLHLLELGFLSSENDGYDYGFKRL